MNTVVNFNEIQTNFNLIKSKIKSGDEVILEENGKQLAKIIPLNKKRILGREKGKIIISDDFDDELPEEVIKDFYK